MHIPNGMLQGAICPVTAVISVAGIGFAAFKAFFAKAKPSAARFAARGRHAGTRVSVGGTPAGRGEGVPVMRWRCVGRPARRCTAPW